MTLHSPYLMQSTIGDPDLAYPAREFRAVVRSMVQALSAGVEAEGVVSDTSFQVQHRGAGANFSVDILSGRALIVGGDISGQCTYHVWSDATYNLVTPGAPVSGTRVHRVVLQIRDKLHNGSYSTYEFIPLLLEDTGSGTPGEPVSAITLALVSIQAGDSNVTDSSITDYRARVGDVAATKSADDGRASTTTVANDADLQLGNLAANATYELRGNIIFSGGADASEGGLKFSWGIPAGSNLRYSAPHCPFPHPSDGHISSFSLNSSAASAGTNGVDSDYAMQIQGLLTTGSTPGKLIFKWAQESSAGTNTWVRQGSNLIAHRVA